MCTNCGDMKHKMGANESAKSHNKKSKMSKIEGIKKAMEKAKK